MCRRSCQVMFVPSRTFTRSRICRRAKYVSGRTGVLRVTHRGSNSRKSLRLAGTGCRTKDSGVAGTQIGTAPPFGTTLTTPRPASIPPHACHGQELTSPQTRPQRGRDKCTVTFARKLIDDLCIGAFPMAERRRLFTELQSLVTTFEEHPWNWAAHMAWRSHATPKRGLPLERRQRSVVHAARPERVVEVRYDHMEGERFRHTAQFNRWRPTAPTLMHLRTTQAAGHL